MTQSDSNYQLLEDIAERKFGSDSNEHFAARLTAIMHQLQIARREKFQEALEVLNFELGECCATWKLKYRAEGTWRVGQKVRSGGREGAERAYGPGDVRKQTNKKIQQTVDRYIAHGHTKMKAYVKVAKEMNIGASTVRRRYRSE